LRAIRWITGPAPGQRLSILALVDDASQPARTLWRQDLGSDPTVAPKYSNPSATTNWSDQQFTAQWGLLDGGSAVFQNLTVAACSAGTFEIDVA
jgi:hypothetical protein